MTLVVNGSTTRLLIHRLGLHRLVPARIQILSTAVRFLRGNKEENFKILKRDRFLSAADWKLVRAYLPKLDISEKEDASTDFGDLAIEARRRIFEAEKRSYWRQYHKGLLQSESVRVLVESADLAIDKGSHLERTE